MTQRRLDGLPNVEAVRPSPSIVILGAAALVTLGTLAGLPGIKLATVAVVVTAVTLGYRLLLRWSALLAGMMLVILFIPIKKYSMPGDLPFDLEPYRLFVLLIAIGWLLSLLVDERVRLRAGGLDAQLCLLVVAMLAGVAVNGERIRELKLDSEVTKGLTFFLSYLVIYYLIVSVVRSLDHVDRLVRILVAGGAVVAGCAVYEARTRFNVFDHLSAVIPMLELREAPEALTRGGRLRVAGSAQGAIPFGAAMALLVPMAMYVATRSRRWYWWIAVGLIAVAALGTNSRTSVVMMFVILLVFARLRPRHVLRLSPVLIALAIVVHIALPGTIGTIRQAFFPEGGLIAEQSRNPGWRGSGRLADLGPALTEWSERPFLGQGYSTRVTGRVNTNAAILDDQWLKTLLETGIIGAGAWLWLFGRAVRRHMRMARHDFSDLGWLNASLAASLLAFAVGMMFYDAFSFIQVTFLVFILLALGSTLFSVQREAAPAYDAAHPSSSLA